MKKADPKAIVGLFAVPWSRSERRGAVVSVLGHDRRALADAVDVVTPMAYPSLLQQPPAWVAAAVSDASLESGRPVWPIIYAGNADYPVEQRDFRAAAEAAWKEPSQGLIVFDFDDLAAGSRLSEMSRAFRRCRAR